MKNTWRKGLIAASIALGLIAVRILWPLLHESLRYPNRYRVAAINPWDQA